MRVGSIMHHDVVTVGPEATCSDAARLLRNHEVSALVVDSGSGPTGIVTERDLVRLIASGQDPSTVPVAAQMTAELVTIDASADVDHAARLMDEHHIRHLPVVDRGKVVGIVSIRDPLGRHPALQRHEEHRRQSLQARIADRVTTFAGSMPFVYVHAVWFTLWIALRVEDFPFGLLTMIVSLEAIFLSTFVMISQNRADERRQVLADHQWELVQHEERQNEELLVMSERILDLTSAIHDLAVATLGEESPLARSLGRATLTDS